ncbi:Uncharacterised protein [Salmonella enterica subsp. enterica serovar Bovismorbificans]|uniref:Uncharacterized protein n=1 Tax=Salmonella enterica subsp. enterica serovar Bovismorbificans TaxID=58097 RepID=A0A655DAL6_SALET|nr:Uncharacterised protein [Salmonella enterica subsp. enterica serovar Bovismorbificans]
MPVFIAESGHISVVVTRFVRDDDIADLQRGRQTACGTGIDDHVRLAVLQKQRCAQRRRDFTDTGFQQRHFGAVQLASVNFAAAQRNRLTVVNFVTQQRNFFFHCANDADFHRFTRDKSVLGA